MRGCRALTDARRGVIVRAVARAEITAEIAAILPLGGAERHAAQMGADAERDQPVLLAGLGALIEGLRLAQVAERHLLGFGDFLRDELAQEHRLLAPAGLARLAGLAGRNLDFGRSTHDHARR